MLVPAQREVHERGRRGGGHAGLVAEDEGYEPKATLLTLSRILTLTPHLSPSASPSPSPSPSPKTTLTLNLTLALALALT